MLSDDNDDDEDDDEFAWGPRRSRQPLDPNRFPKVPSERGTELMHSGTFGASEVGSTLRSKKRIARRLLDRELGLGDAARRRVNQGMMTQVRRLYLHAALLLPSRPRKLSLSMTLTNAAACSPCYLRLMRT